MSAIDSQALGDRIREARERTGLPQGAVAELAGLERTVYNKIETGARRVSALELSDISAALGTRMASFFTEPTPALVAHRERNDRETVDSRMDRLIEELARDVELLDSLAPDEMGLASAQSKIDEITPGAPQSSEAAEDLANDARRAIGLDAREPAHDLVGLVGRLGLLAFSSPLGAESPDAGTVLLRAGGVSLVNSTNKVGRRRLALAHELGHYLSQDQYTIDWRVAGQDQDGLESRMDRFARAVLLPEDGLREAWQNESSRKLREIAVILGSHFRVDMSTLSRRAQEIGLVDTAEGGFIRKVSTTRADFVDFGLYMREELEETTLPIELQRAVLRLVRDERISKERALDLLRDTFADADLPQVRTRRDNEIWNFVS